MTLENNTQNISHLFNEKFRKYEEKLVAFLLDISQIKRVNPKISIISSYLLIHEKLTQKELKELTGFSMGSISTLLSVMTGTEAFKKERIIHTHTYTYSFSGNLEDLTTKGYEIALSSFSSFERFLKNKKKELNILIEQSKEGAEHLSQRIEELLESFEIYENLFPMLTRSPNNGTTKEYSLEGLILIKTKKQEAKKIKFDPEIYMIEDDMINQLAASPMFASRDPMFIRILGYFMTRKYLTQNRLKRITGLSTGKISEEINMLLKNGLIEKVNVSDKGKITYGAESAGKMLLKFSRSVLYRMANWDDELQNMRSELEDNRIKLESLNGYSRIYQINKYLLDTISNYKRLMDMLDIILKS